jgi:hypothetical protein
VKYQIGQRNGKYQIFLFTAEEGVVLEGINIGTGRFAALIPGDVLIGYGQKAAGAAAGIVHGFTRLRVDGVHHCADYFSRGEELPAVGVLFPHFQEQVFIDL